MTCHCGSGKMFDQCCGRYLDAGEQPETPEALMRSRYTAYATGRIHYIQDTCRGPALASFDFHRARNWAAEVSFNGLTVMHSSQDGDCGTVTFLARFLEDGVQKELLEQSLFLRESGRWFYVDQVG